MAADMSAQGARPVLTAAQLEAFRQYLHDAACLARKESRRAPQGMRTFLGGQHVGFGLAEQKFAELLADVVVVSLAEPEGQGA